ncbi:MAG: YugN family protein [Tuberibacillus sp.]
MRFENTGIEGTVVPFPELEDVMNSVGFIRGGAWDYERVTYDFKFEDRDNGNVYYLRVPGVAIESEIEKRDCIVKLGVPYVGHHYYPHGVEYDEVFPDHIVHTSQNRLAALNEALSQLKEYVHKG